MTRSTQQAVQTVAVIGLGYVGAPLAFALAKNQNVNVIGYDVNQGRVDQLKAGVDSTGEISEGELALRSKMVLTASPEYLFDADVMIITVPTPVNEGHVPDMSYVLRATHTAGSHMKKGAVIVYESTVYPGATEEECLPLLEKIGRGAGLSYPADFSIGYSPERINPGDRVHTLHNTTKIVAGDRPATLDLLASLYGSITQVHRAPTIKVAEAAKCAENAQRDVNIAFMNELCQICTRLGVDTHDVLAAAGTKWNFLPFRPGLVGGHCIGVDPYYLMHKAAAEGYPARLIVAARETNDSMAGFLANLAIKRMACEGLLRPGAVVTVLGATFKEDVPDIRNSKVVDLVRELGKYGVTPQIVDPHADPAGFSHEYGLELTAVSQTRPADALLLTVPHRRFAEEHGSFENLINICAKRAGRVVVMDLKAVLNRDLLDQERFSFWRP
ncbi:nucleotide sugar dehydrogenase [Achromobacter xylosoxidans]